MLLAFLLIASASFPQSSATASAGKISLLLPLLNREDPASDLAILKPYLRPGDILVFPPAAYPFASRLKKEIPGLQIGTGGTNIASLLPGIRRLPPDVDIVTYDYEPDFTPEFSRSQAASLALFARLKEEARRRGKRFLAVPVYLYGKDWDWGKVAESMDVIVVQVQNFQTGAHVPESITPAALKIDLTDVSSTLVGQIRSKSPATRIYLQFGFEVTDNPLHLLQDVKRVQGSGIDGIALWYNPGISARTSKLQHLVELLRWLRPSEEHGSSHR